MDSIISIGVCWLVLDAKGRSELQTGHGPEEGHVTPPGSQRHSAVSRRRSDKGQGVQQIQGNSFARMFSVASPMKWFIFVFGHRAEQQFEIPEDEAEWVGLTLEEAVEKQRQLEHKVTWSQLNKMLQSHPKRSSEMCMCRFWYRKFIYVCVCLFLPGARAAVQGVCGKADRGAAHPKTVRASSDWKQMNTNKWNLLVSVCARHTENRKQPLFISFPLLCLAGRTLNTGVNTAAVHSLSLYKIFLKNVTFIFGFASLLTGSEKIAFYILYMDLFQQVKAWLYMVVFWG